MDIHFETMLRLFGASSNGHTCDIPDGINTDAVISYAHKQGIWQLVYPLIAGVGDAKKYHMQFLTAVSNGIRRNEFTLDIIEKIQSLGIDICLLKGVFASSLYATPDYRISSDTDVLINAKDEKKVMQILKDAGYTIGTRNKNDHHLKCKHPVGGLLEVHISLYSAITDKIVFGGKINYDEPFVEFECGKRRIKTLGVNDNLNYLTAHYIKHFITGGSSVRQMMDLLLYIKHYESEIDFDKYNDLLTKLKYDKLIAAVQTIGALYFGMDFPVSQKALADEILADCEAVGLFGSNSDSDTSIYSEYCRSRREVSSLKLRLIFMFKDEASIFNRLFPSQEVLLKRGINYARFKPLIPIAWIHCLFTHSSRKKEYEEKKKSSLHTNNRKKLMQKLEMIED